MYLNFEMYCEMEQVVHDFIVLNRLFLECEMEQVVHDLIVLNRLFLE